MQATTGFPRREFLDRGRDALVARSLLGHREDDQVRGEDPVRVEVAGDEPCTLMRARDEYPRRV